MTWSPSLFRHLMAWSLGTVLLVWGTFVAIGFQTGGHEADELTDGHLASVASLMLTQRLDGALVQPDAGSLDGRGELKAHDYQQSLSIIEWGADGRQLARIGEAPAVPFDQLEGFQTLRLGQPATSWRTFSRWDRPARQRKVMVLLSVAERDELADDIAAQVATPGLWLLPVVALLLTFAVRRGLRPLIDLSHQVGRLEIGRDTSLQGPPHKEFGPVVLSINTLIQRYAAALERERALASEVAHELRTPLASLSLHAASLRGSATQAERNQTLQRIEQDALRAGSVLTQLLSLARASRAELAGAAQPTDLARLVRAVVAEYAQAGHESGHVLSLHAPSACSVNAHPLLLEIALRNLIDNALAHTPAGTAVQVTVAAEPPSIEVCDDGPLHGQPAPEPRSSSAPGLGLGHQVVGRVALVHHGHFSIRRSAAGTHTCCKLTLGHIA